MPAPLPSCPRVVTFDLSLTSTGFALHDGTTGIMAPGTKRTGPERLDWIRGRILDTLTRGGYTSQDLVAMEDFAYARPQGATSAGGLGWLIRWTLWAQSIPYVLIPPTSVKKYATGKGNAKKAQVVSAVTRLTGREFSTDDEPDAWTLWAMTCHAYGWPKVPETDYRAEALDAISWPELNR